MSDRILVSTRKGLFSFTRRGPGRWREADPAFLGVPVTITLWDARDGTVYAGLDHGHFGVKVHRAADPAGPWQEVAAPTFPEFKGEEPELDGSGKPWPRTTKYLWELGPDPRSDGALWCGTVPGGLFHSPDRGASWRLVDGLWEQPERFRWFGGGMDLPGIHSVCVHPENHDDVLVAVSCGGLWRTRDGGAQWQVQGQGLAAAYVPEDEKYDPVIQDPHRIAVSPADPKRVWCQHHNGMFRSDNGGETFTEIERAGPSTFGFACAAHPENPDIAWFVPGVKDECRVPVDGKLVVTRTSDGGKTFEVLDRGLPEPPVWDIVFRHGLAVDGTGRRLVFGTTTGALFATEDGGDSWSCLSRHLPQVYAVCFA